MKTNLKFALLIGTLVWGISTTKAQVATDFDKSVDFTKYKTFAWCTPDIQVGNNPVYRSGLITKNIETTLADELGKRGLTMNPENPDLLVGFHTYTEKKTNTYSTATPYPMYYPFGFRAGWRYYPYGFGNWPYAWNNNIQHVQYTEGTLLVDIVDAHTKQLIWRGSVEGDVSNPKRIEKEVAKGIHKVMKDYPVPVAERS
ncbi:DUF4136 domain-containing protein [Spirosoma soli]|uniref:DUF4136 domain-containing protein n=1 Tax=Spirosoma soli TaxID=1770529 RepID=A0ABW5M0P3_9BACT